MKIMEENIQRGPIGIIIIFNSFIFKDPLKYRHISYWTFRMMGSFIPGYIAYKILLCCLSILLVSLLCPNKLIF